MHDKKCNLMVIEEYWENVVRQTWDKKDNATNGIFKCAKLLWQKAFYWNERLQVERNCMRYVRQPGLCKIKFIDVNIEFVQTSHNITQGW